MRKLVLAIAALILPFGAFAADSSHAEAFSTLFATTCMKHFYAPEELRAEMTAKGAPELDGEQSEFFLSGKPGTAWAVGISGDKYVVSWREDGICTVFAQRAPAAEVQSNFTSLVATAPEPLTASQRETGGPNSQTLSTIAYAWHRPKDETELLFTLTTSNDAAATVQAMASMALARRAQ